MKPAVLGPLVHCCWVLEDVQAMFDDAESVTCNTCGYGLFDTLKLLDE